MTADPAGRVACETAMTTGLVLVSGEITTTAVLDVPAIVRGALRRIGYTDPACGFDAESCAVLVAIGRQSPDIAQGVGEALEVRTGADGRDLVAEVGAGDQGMMVGFACDETPELMPLSISLAHGITRRLAHVRKSGELGYLRPDGNSLVTVEYAYGRPGRVEAIVVSTQHSPEVGQEQIHRDVVDRVIRQVVPERLMDEHTRVYVNPTGRFVIGGARRRRRPDRAQDHRGLPRDRDGAAAGDQRRDVRQGGPSAMTSCSTRCGTCSTCVPARRRAFASRACARRPSRPAALAGSVAPHALWAAAAGLDTTTLLGRFRIDPATGAQAEYATVLVRWTAGGLHFAP